MSPRQRERNRWRRDERVRAGHFTWWEFVLTILVLLALPVLPALLYSDTSVIQTTPLRFVAYYVVYCGLVAALFCTVTAWQKRVMFDRPLQTLCDAARRVASGDFSVTITPPHPPEKADYMDVMFTDFNRMVEELGSIQTLKDDFVANVSHEIKTPLAVIRSYVEALESPGLSEETRRQYMATIVEATDKLSTLVSNILRLNKLENQKITARPEPYDLCRQLGDCVLGFEELWDRKRIEPMVDIEEQVMLNADEGMMELVWNNLLSNAIKFTPEGGLVTLRQWTEGSSIVVEVGDTGCGMSEETMRRAFEKFYQGNTAHAGEGNGLGLALAQRVVTMAGGTLQVRSREGEGSVFTVRLPAGDGGEGAR